MMRAPGVADQPTHIGAAPAQQRGHGAPTINGTPRVGLTLTASTSGISDAEGLFWVSYAYQWLADDVEISGATGRRYTLAAADEGKAIAVRVAFNDDAGNDESLTSNAVAASPSIPLTATSHNEPESHDGSAAFTFELRLSESPAGAFTQGTMRNALTATGGSVSNARRLDRNLRWEITVQPSSNADVTSNAAHHHGLLRREAICTIHNVMLSSTFEFTVSGSGTSNQQSRQKTRRPPALPPSNGTARVGDTLTANTTGIADSDGVVNVSFTYQWLADSTEINDATGSSYTVADADAGKAIKVRVSFTDDGGNAESLTSAATAAVALPALRLQTPAVDGATLTPDLQQRSGRGCHAADQRLHGDGGQQPQVVSSVSVSGRAVTLTLASAVASGEAVTVSYTKPRRTQLHPGHPGQQGRVLQRRNGDQQHRGLDRHIAAVGYIGAGGSGAGHPPEPEGHHRQ